MSKRVRVLTGDQIDDLIACHRGGESTHALALRFGINRHTVSGYLRKARNAETVGSSNR